jgi:hypothetical protein
MGWINGAIVALDSDVWRRVDTGRGVRIEMVSMIVIAQGLGHGSGQPQVGGTAVSRRFSHNHRWRQMRNYLGVSLLVLPWLL